MSTMLDTSPKFLCDMFIYKHYLLVQTGTTDKNFLLQCSACVSLANIQRLWVY